MADIEDFKNIQQVKKYGFNVLNKKGQGSYGVVYEVGNNKGELYAFKYVPYDSYYSSEGLDNLCEIDILSRVDHPHIIHCAKIITSLNFDIDGVAFILPLADTTLNDIGFLTTEHKLPIFYKLANTLNFMHKNGILHLDIKSDNVVLQGITEHYPLFIDFGISMFVDDAYSGVYNNRVRVSLDHRPPELLLVDDDNYLYNDSVDVWSFGIMMLKLLSDTNFLNFSSVNNREIYDFLQSLFSNPNTIISLCSGISPKYRDLCIDLLSKILIIDPKQRIKSFQICQHPLFDHIRYDIKGELFIPKIKNSITDYSDDHRDLIKLIIHWSQLIYNDYPCKLLFLAVDLFYRVANLYKDKDPHIRMIIACSCLWISCKIINEPIIDLDDYIPEINKTVPDITKKNILDSEIEIIHFLSGILYVSTLYKLCKTGDQLRDNFFHIVLSKDILLYPNVTSDNIIPCNDVSLYPSKNITIKQLFED